MMAQKKRTPSFESMMNFFLQHYNFATKKDIGKLMDRIDELEKLIKSISTRDPKHTAVGIQKNFPPASDVVLNAIIASKKGATFSHIQEETGLSDKKLRNIIYRLGKLGKIKTLQRGLYIPS
jgi:hypothetical protein